VPNFAKEKAAQRKVSRAVAANADDIYVSSSSNRNLARLPRDQQHMMKRRSIAHMGHQPTFSSLYQLNQINDPRSSLYQRLHHHSYHNMMQPPPASSRHGHGGGGMWHARSYESGIGMNMKTKSQHN